jgi:hypothetical protein
MMGDVNSLTFPVLAFYGKKQLNLYLYASALRCTIKDVAKNRMFDGMQLLSIDGTQYNVLEWEARPPSHFWQGWRLTWPRRWDLELRLDEGRRVELGEVKSRMFPILRKMGHYFSAAGGGFKETVIALNNAKSYAELFAIVENTVFQGIREIGFPK